MSIFVPIQEFINDPSKRQEFLVANAVPMTNFIQMTIQGSTTPYTTVDGTSWSRRTGIMWKVQGNSEYSDVTIKFNATGVEFTVGPPHSNVSNPTGEFLTWAIGNDSTYQWFKNSFLAMNALIQANGADLPRPLSILFERYSSSSEPDQNYRFELSYPNARIMGRMGWTELSKQFFLTDVEFSGTPQRGFHSNPQLMEFSLLLKEILRMDTTDHAEYMNVYSQSFYGDEPSLPPPGRGMKQLWNLYAEGDIRPVASGSSWRFTEFGSVYMGNRTPWDSLYLPPLNALVDWLTRIAK